MVDSLPFYLKGCSCFLRELCLKSHYSSMTCLLLAFALTLCQDTPPTQDRSTAVRRRSEARGATSKKCDKHVFSEHPAARPSERSLKASLAQRGRLWRIGPFLKGTTESLRAVLL
jgi:hypothetical protein